MFGIFVSIAKKVGTCEESPCVPIFRRSGFLTLVVLLVGCESQFVQGYKGNPQPLVQVAVVAKPVNEPPCSETVIYGTDEVQSIRTSEVALLPGKRKIFLLQTKTPPPRVGFDSTCLLDIRELPACLVALPIAYAITLAVSPSPSPSVAECQQVPEETRCIEFEFQAQKGTNYIVVAEGIDDYKLKNQSTGEIVSVGRSLPTQYKSYSERVFVPTYNWINCPPIP